ncbi:hypothetical protein PG987_011752 [Apiospora arundinis]
MATSRASEATRAYTASSIAPSAVIVDEKRELPNAPKAFWGGVQPLHESLRLFRVLCDKWSAVLNVPGEVVQFTLDQAKIPTSVEKVVQAVEASVTQPGLTAKHVLGVDSWSDALEPATPVASA